MDIRVPTLAEGVESGTVVAILVSEGDQVQKDQTVVELETNKAVATIPATEAGTVSQIHVKEGDSVPVGGVLISLGGSGGGAPAAAKSETPVAAPTPAPTPVAAPATPAAPVAVAPVAPGAYQYQSPTGSPPPASPSVRKVARELGIDLSRIRGSEQGGRITMGDVRNYIAQIQQLALSGSGAASAPAASAPAVAAPAAPAIDFAKFGPVTRQPLTQLRKTISKAMVGSWTSIPHVTQFDDIDISHLMTLRKKHLAAYEKQGARLTVTTFIIKAIADTLKEHPIFNASIDEATQEVVLKDYINIGIAVDTEHGLIVPVLKDADQKDLVQLSKDLQEMAEKTRARKVGVEDMQGGTFTISNQGGIGGKHFTPIVNKPEVAILGMGRAYAAPVVANKKVTTGMLMPIGLSYDHRLIDGGSAARFVVSLIDRIASFDDKSVQLGKGKSAGAAKKKAAKKPTKKKAVKKKVKK